jgi:hypothetical protein
VFDVLADRAFGLPKKPCELFLVEPQGLVLQPNIQLGLPVLTLVNQKLVHSHRLLMFMSPILLYPRMAVKLRDLLPLA